MTQHLLLQSAKPRSSFNDIVFTPAEIEGDAFAEAVLALFPDRSTPVWKVCPRGDEMDLLANQARDAVLVGGTLEDDVLPGTGTQAVWLLAGLSAAFLSGALIGLPLGILTARPVIAASLATVLVPSYVAVAAPAVISGRLLLCFVALTICTIIWAEMGRRLSHRNLHGPSA